MTGSDDRVADRRCVVSSRTADCPVTRIRPTLAQLSGTVRRIRSASRRYAVRGMLQHRGRGISDGTWTMPLSLIVFVRAVKLLSRLHLVVVAGIHSPPEISDWHAWRLDWNDPLVALPHISTSRARSRNAGPAEKPGLRRHCSHGEFSNAKC